MYVYIKPNMCATISTRNTIGNVILYTLSVHTRVHVHTYTYIRTYRLAGTVAQLVSSSSHTNK